MNNKRMNERINKRFDAFYYTNVLIYLFQSTLSIFKILNLNQLNWVRKKYSISCSFIDRIDWIIRIHTVSVTHCWYLMFKIKFRINDERYAVIGWRIKWTIIKFLCDGYRRTCWCCWTFTMAFMWLMSLILYYC